MTEQEIYRILDEECREDGAINPHKAAKLLASAQSDVIIQKLDEILKHLTLSRTLRDKKECIRIDKSGKLMMPPEEIARMGLKNGDYFEISGAKMVAPNGDLPHLESFKIGNCVISWMDNLSAYQFQTRMVECPSFKAKYTIGDAITLMPGGSPNFNYQSSDINFILFREPTH